MASKNIIKRFISSPLVQTLLIYVSGAWIVIELTDYFVHKFELSEKISNVLLLILLAGLPLALILTWYLSRESDEKETDLKTADSKINLKYNRFWKKRWITIPGIVILILLVGTGIRIIHKQSRIKWVKTEAIPEMQILLVEYDYYNAFELLHKAKKYLSGDSLLHSLESQISTRITVFSEPEGADVYYQPYSDTLAEWTLLGITPLDKVEFPLYTLCRWKFEKNGYETAYSGNGYIYSDTLFRTLFKKGSIPEGMVYVEGVNVNTPQYLSKNSNGYFIDKFEVTNRQYKEFVDNDGYRNPDYWQSEIILDKDTLSFEEALSYFKDATEQPGPANWVAGDYPDGWDNYPVQGISWYEAEAYASYVGKELPTQWHWWSAAGNIPRQNWGIFALSPAKYSNIGGAGPEAVGSHRWISCFGTYDMAGNVREWCWNQTPDGRMLLGGAWNDAIYMATALSQAPPFDRSIKNGFRCISYPEMAVVSDSLLEPGPFWGLQRDYRFEEPVPEYEYLIYRKQFLYDRQPLNSNIEKRDTLQADWTLEKISFDAAYENERMVAYLFLPKDTDPPFQTVIHFPGASALSLRSIFANMRTQWTLDYIIKNGRAVLFPIYKGTYERNDGTCNSRFASQTHQYTECMVKRVKDFSRSIDYLETRKDINSEKLAYLGDSWGGTMGAIIPAVECRLKLAILIRGGFDGRLCHPEADALNYVPHIKIPVLMLNGKYDHFFPLEYSSRPMFNMIGTEEKDKLQILYDTDHFIPKNEMIKEVLYWLDLYLGSV